MDTVNEILMKAYAGLLTVALPLAIAAIAGSIVVFVLAWQLKQSRQKLRDLRLALEQRATPDVIMQGLKLYPDVRQLAERLQGSELVKRANVDEGNRVRRIETLMGFCRTLLGIGVLLAIVVVLGRYFPPGK